MALYKQLRETPNIEVQIGHSPKMMNSATGSPGNSPTKINKQSLQDMMSRKPVRDTKFIDT